MSIDPRLLEMLVCPGCREAVELRADGSAVDCGGCGRSYPVRDGIAVMLVDQAEEPKGGPEPDSR